MRRFYQATTMDGTVYKRTTEYREYNWCIVTTFRSGEVKTEWRRTRLNAQRTQQAAHRWPAVANVELAPAKLVKGPSHTTPGD